MKTILTTIFAVAVMAFAFNATLAHANEKSNKKVREFFRGPDPKQYSCELYQPVPTESFTTIRTGSCREITSLDEANESDQADNERDVADSGNEGSTSAAGATE